LREGDMGAEQCDGGEQAGHLWLRKGR
jgi:hypothetical protein